MKYKEVNNDLIISVEGRIDTNNNQEVLNDIRKLQQQFPEKSLILDFDNLAYISSAGLRAMLILQKEEENGIRIINASNDIFDIFSVTGFSSLISIEKKLRSVNIENAELIGEGVTGKTYKLNDEQIVKVFSQNIKEDLIRKERDLAQKAFLQGINTAIPFDEVKVEDSFGIVYEAINSKSIYQLVMDDLEHADDISKKFGQLMKESHKIKLANSESYIDQKDVYLNYLEKFGDLFNKEDYEKLHTLINRIPYSNSFNHGDFHPGNALLQNDNLVLIDMLTVGKGSPIFDWIGYYSATVLAENTFGTFKEYKQFNPIPSDVIINFYNNAFKEYYNDVDLETFNNIKSLIELLAPIRGVFLFLDHLGLPKDSPFIQLYLNKIHQNFEGLDVENLDLEFLNID